MAGNIWHDVSAAKPWDLPDLDAEAELTREAAAEQEAKLHTAGELDQLQREAYREGFERGHADGLRTGAEAAREHASRLAALLEALADPLRQVDMVVERTLAGLALTMTKRMVRQAAESPETLQVLIHDAVEALNDPEANLQVYLHPQDKVLLEQYLEQEDRAAPWQLRGDTELERGDVVVSNEVSEVDARLTHRLQRLEAEMLGES